jgi:DNA-binding PadR family transcriptional regulator
MPDTVDGAEVEGLLPLPPAVFHILVSLAEGDRHGYSILREVLGRTRGLRLGPGTLYGSIKRMLEQGLIEEVRPPRGSEGDHERRRYYRLTRFGRRVAEAEAARLSDVVKRARAHGLLPHRG